MNFFTGTYRALANHLADRIIHERSSTFDAWLERPVEILVPSRSVASGIAAALLERRPAGLAGVTMHTPEELAAKILAAAGNHARVADDSERRLAMRAAVAAVSDAAFERRGAAAMVERTYRDIRDSGLTAAEFEARSRRLRPANAGRIASLCAAFRLYEGHVRAIGAIDPAERLAAAAAEAAAHIGIAQQTIFGFYDVTGIQERFLNALAAHGAVGAIYVPVETAANGLTTADTRFGSRVVDTLRALGATPQAVDASADALMRVRSSFTPDIELLEVCRGVRDALDAGTPAGAIGIVARANDEAEHRELARCARLFGFRLTSEPGTRLAAQRLARGLLLLLRLRRDGYRRSDVIEILHCGIDRGAVALNDRPAWLDEATRAGEIPGGTAATVLQALPRMRADNRSQWLVAPVESYATVVGHLERVTAELETTRGAEAWASLLERLAKMFVLESEPDLAAFHAINAIAATLRRTAPFGATLDAETIAAMIEEGPELPRNPAHEELPAVWYGDVMRLRGRSFRLLFAVRLQHDRFPQRRVEDPLLPDPLRGAIGVRQIGDGRDEERMLFRILTAAAGEVLECSYAVSDGVGGTLRPSQLLKDALIARHPDAKSEIVGKFDSWLARNAPPPLRAETTVERTAAAIRSGGKPAGRSLARRLRAIGSYGTRSAWDGYLTVDEALAEKLAEQLARLSPSYLEWFGECPHRFLYSRLLRIGDLGEPEEQVQIEQRAKGSLDHDILEHFYRDVFSGRPAVTPPWTPQLAAELKRAIDQAFDEFDRTHPPANPPLRSMERALTHVKLARFVAADFEALRDADLVPREFEFRIDDGTEASGPLAVRVGGIELPIWGLVDRIDEALDATRVRIVDYKSGKAYKQRELEKKIEAGHSLQLAFYAIAVAQLRNIDDANVSGRILPLDEPESRDKQFSFALKTNREALETILPLFVEAMRTGVFPAYTGDWCGYCALKPHCRTFYSTEEERQLDDFDNVREMLEARRSSHV